MNDELISVIVPVYNVEDCLDLSLKSILNQTYSNLEIIVINDGSTDSSGEICERWARIDKRIIYKEKTNGGLSDARNYGLGIASGEYISFIDSDDYIDPFFYEKLMKVVKKYRVQIGCCRFDIFEDTENASWFAEAPKSDGHVECMDARSFLLNMIYYDHGYTTPSVWDRIYHKSIVDGVCFPKGKNYEDIFFSTQIICKAERIGYLDECLYHYRVRRGSISYNSSIFDKRIITDMFYLRNQQLEYIKKNNYYDVLVEYRMKYVAEAAYYLSINPYTEYNAELNAFIRRWRIGLQELFKMKKNRKSNYLLKSCVPLTYSCFLKVKMKFIKAF